MKRVKGEGSLSGCEVQDGLGHKQFEYVILSRIQGKTIEWIDLTEDSRWMAVGRLKLNDDVGGKEKLSC